MGKSAFEVLIVPVFLGTLQGFAAGAAILAVMNGAEALFGLLGRAIRSFKASHRPALVTWHRVHRPAARGVRSIG
jgi:hypothetical protein